MSYRGKQTGSHGVSKRSVRSFQASRSKRAQSIDGGRKAPIAKNIDDWFKSPNRLDLPNIDTPKSAPKDVDVGVPSLSLLKKIENLFPEKLSDSTLARYYGLLKAARLSFIQGALPKEYYNSIADAGGATGRVPKDVFALTNIDFSLDEYSKEFSKRKIMDNYSFTIDPFHSDKERSAMD